MEQKIHNHVSSLYPYWQSNRLDGLECTNEGSMCAALSAMSSFEGNKDRTWPTCVTPVGGVSGCRGVCFAVSQSAQGLSAGTYCASYFRRRQPAASHLKIETAVVATAAGLSESASFGRRCPA